MEGVRFKLHLAGRELHRVVVWYNPARGRVHVDLHVPGQAFAAVAAAAVAAAAGHELWPRSFSPDELERIARGSSQFSPGPPPAPGQRCSRPLQAGCGPPHRRSWTASSASQYTWRAARGRWGTQGEGQGAGCCTCSCHPAAMGAAGTSGRTRCRWVCGEMDGRHMHWDAALGWC